MKKILAYTFSFILILSLLSGIGVLANGTDYTMTVGVASGEAGETVEVEVVLQNNPGISSAILEIVSGIVTSVM